MKVIKKLSSGLGIAAIIIVFLIPFYIMFYLSLSGAGSSFAEVKVRLTVSYLM